MTSRLASEKGESAGGRAGGSRDGGPASFSVTHACHGLFFAPRALGPAHRPAAAAAPCAAADHRALYQRYLDGLALPTCAKTIGKESGRAEDHSPWRDAGKSKNDSRCRDARSDLALDSFSSSSASLPPRPWSRTVL